MAVFRNDRHVEFDDVTVIKESEKAILVDIEGDEVWIPVSQLHKTDNECKNEDDKGTLVITQWIAREKHLID